MPRIRSGALDVLLGERLKDLRVRAGLSQSELGERVGISFQQIQKYERGQSRISASLLFRLAEMFDVQVQHFYQGLSEPDAAPVQAEIETDVLQYAQSEEGRALLAAFSAIRSARLRRHILELIETAVETAGR